MVIEPSGMESFTFDLRGDGPMHASESRILKGFLAAEHDDFVIAKANLMYRTKRRSEKASHTWLAFNNLRIAGGGFEPPTSGL